MPVRLAALTAERLASGRLEERMNVRGEDEIARLASSFNSMAAALQTQIRQLEDLSRVQRRFVSDVSHELRTPLTTVRMAADLLHERRGDLDPPAARSAELLQKELDRFEEMLIDLLEISRYDAGAASLDPERQDLVPLVHRVVDATRPLAERRGSTIEVHTSGPVIAEVDHVRIERIVRNLLVNAVEHGEGRPIEVTVADGLGGVAVVVRDHGVGLAPGQAALVFTRFWRGDPSRARATGGTGLGLAIALEDARLHGGSLQAWGAPGQGAAFRLTLPHTVGGEVGESPLSLRPQVMT
jgi:two-component system sensor histidine kinase MtrB